jgi:hypothetical protein
VPSETDDIPSLRAVDNLPDNVLLLLGGTAANVNEPDVTLHAQLASSWQNSLGQGLASDELSGLTEKYIRPTNCEQLEPPEINEMVAQVMSVGIGNKNRDQTLCSSQKQLTTALSVLGQAITRMLNLHTYFIRSPP